MKFSAIEDPDGNMYEMATKVVLKCSEVGMIPGDDHGENFTLFCDAIEKADIILVDQMYILRCKSAYVLNKNVEINGIGADCGFDITGNTTIFEVGDECYQLEINSLTIKNTGEQGIVIFTKEDIESVRMQFVKMNGCHIFGKISPFRFSQSSDVNPDIVNIGIDYISICNNEFYDISCSAFVFRNVSFNTAEVKGNIIRNFDWVFFHCGTDNESPYSQEISNSKLLLSVCDNDVSCDDECFHAVGSGMYYAFVLAECVKVNYNNNKVVGMKSYIDVSLYDAYLTSDEVLYTNNIWKNNCVLVKSANNTLMKAKQKVKAAIGYRMYRNNVYIAEKEFYEKFNATADVAITMISNTEDNNWDICDNYISVYRLRGTLSSGKFKNLTFKNNIVNADVWVEGYLLGGTSKSEIICDSNKISCVDGSKFGGLTTGDYYIKKYVFTNNVMENCRYPLGNGKGDVLIITGNSITDELNVNSRLFGYAKFDHVIGDYNVYTKKDGVMAIFDNYIKEIEYTGCYTFGSTFEKYPIFFISENAEANFVIEFHGEVFGLQYQLFTGYIAFSVLNGYIRYTDLDGNVQTVKMCDVQDLDLKINMISGSELPFEVKLHLGTDYGNYLSFTKVDNTRIKMDVKLFTTTIYDFFIPADYDLPSEYKQVEYIESNGTQYIDTGILASDYMDGIGYEFDGVVSSQNTSSEWLWGALNDSKRSGNIEIVENSRLGLVIGGTNKTVRSTKALVDELIRLKMFATSLSPTQATLSLNGMADMDLDVSDVIACDMPSANIYLLKCSGSSRAAAKAKIYAFKMTDVNGVELRNFVPCYRVKDNIVGLYDTVAMQFYENAGTGSFEKGKNI